MWLRNMFNFFKIQHPVRLPSHTHVNQNNYLKLEVASNKILYNNEILKYLKRKRK